MMCSLFCFNAAFAFCKIYLILLRLSDHFHRKRYMCSLNERYVLIVICPLLFELFFHFGSVGSILFMILSRSGHLFFLYNHVEFLMGFATLPLPQHLFIESSSLLVVEH